MSTMKVDKQKFDALLDRMVLTPPMKRDDLRTKPRRKRASGSRSANVPKREGK